MGADQVVNRHDFATTVQEAGGADYVFSTYTEGKEEELAQAMNTRGQLVFIDDPVSLKVAILRLNLFLLPLNLCLLDRCLKLLIWGIRGSSCKR